MKFCLLPFTLLLINPLAVTTQESPPKPFDRIELMALEAAGISGIRLAMLLQKRGMDFQVTDNYLEDMKAAGAEPELIDALRHTKPTPALAQGGATGSDRTESPSDEDLVLRHLAQGAKIEDDIANSPADAEVEYRAALQIDPQNPFLHFVLAKLLSGMGKQKENDAVHEFREAVRLKPGFAEAHLGLGRQLADLDQRLAEYREAVRLEPDNSSAHLALSRALEEKGEKKEAEEEYRTADELPATGGIPKRIRVSRGVLAGKLRSQSQPKYPREARKAGIQGTVRLEAVIGRDGTVKDIKVLSGDLALVQAAVESVRHWRYQPTLLKGYPVEVQTEIDVIYQLHR
jgi:TonB family protein